MKPKLDALVLDIDDLERMSKKKLRRQLSETRRAIKTLRDVASLIDALLTKKRVKRSGGCKPSWERAAEVCRDVRATHPKATYREIHAVARSRGLIVPARWQTLEGQNQAYWRWRNDPSAGTHKTHPKRQNTPPGA